MTDLLRTAACFGIFDEMLSRFRAANLDEALRGSPARTLLLVPDDLFKVPTGDAAAWLNRHILVEPLDGAAIAARSWVYTLGGERLPVGGSERLSIGGVPVLQRDVRARNGFLHVLEATLPEAVRA